MNILKVLAIGLILIFSAACQDKQQPETAKQEKIKQAGQKFDSADQKLSQILDKIESSETDPDTRKQLVCHEYPVIYKEQYMPALLELSPEQFSKDSLLSDYDFVEKDFKERYNIQCD